MAHSIEEIRHKYNDLFEYSTDYVFITDLNGKIIDVNKVLLQNLEISASKILSKNLYEFIVYNGDIQEQNEKQKLIRFKTSTEPLIYNLNKKKGIPIFIEVSKIPIKKKNQVIAFLGIGHDITRQINFDKTLNEITQHSKEVENIINHSPAVVIRWKNAKDWPVEFVSDNIIQFGYKPKDFLTGNLLYSDIIYPDDLEQISEKFMQCGQEDYNEFTHECRIITKNGQTRWINHQILAKQNDKREITNYQGVILDITKKKNEELKLKESEERFKKLFKRNPYFLTVWQKVKDDFILIAYNNIAKEYSRFDFNELLGKNTSKFPISEEDRRILFENLNHCIEEKNNFTKENEFYDESLKRRIGRMITYIYIPPDLVLFLVEDITKRKTVEKNLRESEEKYRTIIEDAKEGYYEVDLRGNYTLVNNAYCKLFEYSREELIGQNYEIFTTKETSKKTFTTFNTVYNTGIEQSSFEYEVITKSGNIKYGNTSIHLIYDQEGNKIGFRGFIKETTEKKLAEEKLKESEERFRKLFKGSPNFTIAWQKVEDDFVLIDYNDGADKISNGGIIERIGQTASQMYIKELNRPDLVENLNVCIENKKNYTKEFQRYIDFVDAERDLKTKYTYVPPDLVLSNIEDITERKKQEQKLKESEAKYHNAYERENFYKDLFMHDMSNILQGMLSSLELCHIILKDSNQVEDITYMLENLREQIHRGASLVKNVRKFSDLQDSDITLKNINVKDLLENTINVVKKSSLTKTINIQVEGFNDNIEIQSDEFLSDVFENILFNAVKHNENSIVEIMIKLSEIQEDNKKFLKIEFIDNGYGIDDSRKLTIFKRGFYKDRSIVGIGLGLSLVYNILNRYSAKIWVENRVPEDYTMGSKFILQFPLI